MEIREGLVVTPVSATRRFPPTRWHPQRAGTGRAPKASRCWRRHSNSTSVCTRIFRATKTPAVRAYWIKEEDYPALLKLFDDGDKMPPSWKEWLNMAEGMEQGLK